MADTIRTFEAEIRDTNNHTSDSMADDAGATVNVDTLHPNSLEEYERIRVYVDDTHDGSFDITSETAAHDDDDWSAVTVSNTYSLAAGQDQTTFTIDGPVGQLRFALKASLATSLTAGRTRITVYLF